MEDKNPFQKNISRISKRLEQAFFVNANYMSFVMRKSAFCICENKDADQLRGDREADQRLYFCYSNSKYKISSL